MWQMNLEKFAAKYDEGKSSGGARKRIKENYEEYY